MFMGLNEKYGEIRFEYQTEFHYKLYIGDREPFVIGLYRTVYKLKTGKKSRRARIKREGQSNMRGIIVIIRDEEKPDAMCMVFLHSKHTSKIIPQKEILPLKLDKKGKFQFTGILPYHPEIRRRENTSRYPNKGDIEFLPLEEVDFGELEWIEKRAGGFPPAVPITNL